MQKISIVVPCYNEEDVLEIFYRELKDVIKKLKKEYEYELIFVDDGSKDKTLSIIKKLKNENSNIKTISFSRNFGKEAAIYAGLSNSIGDLTILMDADLQHPPKTILEMLEKMKNTNCDVVATKRRNRKGESLLKGIFAKAFYKIMTVFVPMKQGVQDFRIMKKNVVEAILSLKEYNRFSKGIFSWIGFEIQYIEIDNIIRKDGKTKWSFRKLFKYAIEGITSFTTAPLKISIVLGVIIFFISLIYAIIIICQTLIYGKDTPGYASIMTAVLFIGSIQILTIGVLSEYVSKMYLEIKNRPKYIIKETKQ